MATPSCGGIGVDTYSFLGGFGNDTITTASDNNLDILDLSAFSSDQATPGIVGANLTLTIDGTDSIYMPDWATGDGNKLGTATGSVLFSDGAKTINSTGTGWV